LRVAWLQQLANLIDRARAIDSTLGLSRQARRLPRSIEEAIRDAPVLGGDDADR
jgi:hypothetical protein